MSERLALWTYYDPTEYQQKRLLKMIDKSLRGYDLILIETSGTNDGTVLIENTLTTAKEYLRLCGDKRELIRLIDAIISEFETGQHESAMKWRYFEEMIGVLYTVKDRLDEV